MEMENPIEEARRYVANAEDVIKNRAMIPKLSPIWIAST